MEKTEKLCEACGKEKKGHYKKICDVCYNRIRRKSEDLRQKMKEREESRKIACVSCQRIGTVLQSIEKNICGRCVYRKEREESRKIACVSCNRMGTVLQSREKKICGRCVYRKKREEEREIKRLCDIKRLI